VYRIGITGLCDVCGDSAVAELEKRNGAIGVGVTAGEYDPELRLDVLFLQWPPRLGLGCEFGFGDCPVYLPELEVNEP
jgi:hypothetical protein